MTKNREFTKLILGLGYLILAIVILINFIRSAPESRSHIVNLPAIREDVDLDRMNKQLEEERSLNRELKKMLSGYQQAFGPTGDTRSATPEYPPVDIVEVEKKGLPTISPHLFESRNKTNSPFLPGKNPFVSFLPPVASGEMELPLGQPSEISVRSDPKIPFLMKGNWPTSSVREAMIPGTGASFAVAR